MFFFDRASFLEECRKILSQVRLKNCADAEGPYLGRRDALFQAIEEGGDANL